MRNGVIFLEPYILLENKNRVAWLTMNRPDALNSLNLDLADALVAAIEQINQDPTIRVIVLSGAGKAFCAGGDLKALKQIESEQDAIEFVRRCGEVTNKIAASGKPVIGMINGVAAGAGFNLALACDLLVSSKGARFIQSFTSVGLVPDCGGHWLLPRAVGLWQARKMMYFAQPVDACDAMELGFVAQVSEPDALRSDTAALAEALAKRPPLALKACKNMLLSSQTSTLQEILDMESTVQGKLLLGEDCSEGISAFIQKRTPEFQGKS
jgi:2-(1,2-epoxy-1,2-dihydrophenyl)acetyl-CoA isomerase